ARRLQELLRRVLIGGDDMVCARLKQALAHAFEIAGRVPEPDDDDDGLRMLFDSLAQVTNMRDSGWLQCRYAHHRTGAGADLLYQFGREALDGQNTGTEAMCPEHLREHGGGEFIRPVAGGQTQDR